MREPSGLSGVSGHMGLEFFHISQPQDAVEVSMKTGVTLFYLSLIHAAPLRSLIPEVTLLGNPFLCVNGNGVSGLGRHLLLDRVARLFLEWLESV